MSFMFVYLKHFFLYESETQSFYKVEYTIDNHDSSGYLLTVRLKREEMSGLLTLNCLYSFNFSLDSLPRDMQTIWLGAKDIQNPKKFNPFTSKYNMVTPLFIINVSSYPFSEVFGENFPSFAHSYPLEATTVRPKDKRYFNGEYTKLQEIEIGNRHVVIVSPFLREDLPFVDESVISWNTILAHHDPRFFPNFNPLLSVLLRSKLPLFKVSKYFEIFVGRPETVMENNFTTSYLPSEATLGHTISFSGISNLGLILAEFEGMSGDHEKIHSKILDLHNAPYTGPYTQFREPISHDIEGFCPPFEDDPQFEVSSVHSDYDDRDSDRGYSD